MSDPRSEWKRPRDAVAHVVSVWRHTLGFGHQRDSAEIANLRRINAHEMDGEIDAASALSVAAFRTLYKRVSSVIDGMSNTSGVPIRWASPARRNQPQSGFDARLAVLAGVLAHVKDDTGGQLGKALYAARFSELRFRRLIRLETDADLLREGRRLVRMLDGNLPVASFARALLFWDAKETREIARSYYGAELFGDGAKDQADAPTPIKP